MKTILMLIGLLALLKVLGALGKKFAKASIPPLRIHLIPVPPASHSDFARPHRQELEKLGFRMIGAYQVTEMKGLDMVAFTNTAQAMCAIVYRHPVVKVFVDMVSMTDDDRSLTVTTAPKGGNLDQKPGHRKVFGSFTIPQMFERVLAERPRGNYRVLDESTFQQVFEQAYEKEMMWRQGRGGVTMDEVRREAESMGIKSSQVVATATRELHKGYQKEYEKEYAAPRDKS